MCGFYAKFPVNSGLTGNFASGDWFAADCVAHHPFHLWTVASQLQGVSPQAWLARYLLFSRRILGEEVGFAPVPGLIDLVLHGRIGSRVGYGGQIGIGGLWRFTVIRLS